MAPLDVIIHNASFSPLNAQFRFCPDVNTASFFSFANYFEDSYSEKKVRNF